jgi:hypothetical protein
MGLGGMTIGCKLARPDETTLYNRVRDRFSANVLGGAPIIPESNEFYLINNQYLSEELARDIAELYWKEQDPRYACCDNLIDYAARRKMYPRSAGFAQGYINISGVAGTSLPATLTFTSGANEYVVAAGAVVPSVMPATQSIVLRVQAAVAGAAGNVVTSSAMAVTNAPTGIDATAYVYGSRFCGGTEAETCEAFRTRVLNREAHKPKMMYSDIFDIAAEYPCVTRVLARSGSCCENCDGGCDCNASGIQMYVMMDGVFDYGLIPLDIAEDITRYVFGEKQGAGQGKVAANIYGKVYVAKPAVVNVVVDGLSCLSPSQVQLIRSRTIEAFANLPPSVGLCTKTIEFIVTQVGGSACGSGVNFESDSPDVTFHPGCGDIEPNCDILLVLGSIKFV